MLRYDPSNWYWQVTGDTLVWSSASFSYVTTADIDYQAWLQLGGTLTLINSQSQLSQIMASQCIPIFLQSGLNIMSTFNAGISSFYALDDVTLDQVGIVARDSACGLGLPQQSSTFIYPDLFGNPVTFSAVEIQEVYMAMRDYISAVNIAVANLVFKVPNTTLPSNTVVINV